MKPFCVLFNCCISPFLLNIHAFHIKRYLKRLKFDNGNMSDVSSRLQLLFIASSLPLWILLFIDVVVVVVMVAMAATLLVTDSVNLRVLVQLVVIAPAGMILC